MKPGMQRDLLVTFWVLFDDLVNDDPPGDAAPNTATSDSAPQQGALPPGSTDSAKRRGS